MHKQTRHKIGQLFLCMILIFSLASCELPAINDDETESAPQQLPQIVLKYPIATKDSTQTLPIETAWLRNANDKQTTTWLRAQNQLHNDFFSQLPFYQKNEDQLKEIWNYSRFSLPVFSGSHYYIAHNKGLENQALIYRAENLKDTLSLVLDPNALSNNGAWLMSNYSFSRDGNFMAYELSNYGGLWKRIHVLNLQTGKALSDTILGISSKDIAWYKDGFFYSKFPQQSAESRDSRDFKFQQLFYHKLGTKQQDDELVFADRSSAGSLMEPQTDERERFLLLSIAENTFENRMMVKDLSKEDSDFIPVESNPGEQIEFVGGTGQRLLVLSNHGAKNKRLMQISATKPDKKYWEEIIPETEDILHEVYHVGEYLFAHYLRDASSRLTIYNLEGKEERRLSLPAAGHLSGITKGKSGEEVFFKYSTFLNPGTIYRLDLSDFSTAIYQQPQIAFSEEEYEIRKVRIESYDGAAVLMHMVIPQDHTVDPNTPLLLMVQGGLGESFLPKWNADGLHLVPGFLENGGICATVHVRGGMELGQEWQKSGTGINRQRSIDDLLSAAAYLIANKYTSEQNLILFGEGLGGLTVGAALTQRSDLFKVAILNTPLLDMSTYEESGIAWFWEKELGTCQDTTTCDRLMAFSPIHNIESLNYPATFISTAIQNDVLLPGQSYEFIAKLQGAQNGTNPILLRAPDNAGIGSGKPVGQRIRLGADILSFIQYNLEIKE